MQIRRLTALGASAAVTCIIGLAAASPASAENNEFLYSGTGSVLRATLYEHANGGGHAIYYFGSGNCSSSLTDNDYSRSKMPGWGYNSWNNQVSSFRDYAYCDVKLYDGEQFTTANTGWMNAGATGLNLSSVWNDKASSFRVS